jgi:5-methylcytosine-specific restriction endonuclease McrA
MSVARKGRKFSEDHKRKIALANIGKNAGKSHPCSEENRLAMSIARSGVSKPHICGEKNHRYIDGRSADIEFKRLKVRLAKHHRRTLGKVTRKMWNDLKEQYGHKCPACGEAKPLTLDHIVPVFLGGTNDMSNLQPLCQSCNSRKGTRIMRYANV